MCGLNVRVPYGRLLRSTTRPQHSLCSGAPRRSFSSRETTVSFASVILGEIRFRHDGHRQLVASFDSVSRRKLRTASLELDLHPRVAKRLPYSLSRLSPFCVSCFFSASASNNSSSGGVKNFSLVAERGKSDVAEVVKPAENPAPVEKDGTPPPAAPKAAKNTPPQKRKLGDSLPSTSVDRNFITAIRAMSDFLLKPSDLEGLRKTRRRSPFELEPPIVVFWRKDVEKRAIDVWGNMKKIDEERLKRTRDYALRKKNLFHLKRMLKEYQEGESSDGSKQGPTHALEKVRGSKRVVLSAIAINALNTVMKFGAWMYTGSYSVFSEALHSFADTMNQCILAVGIYQSEKKADSFHPYGYSNAKYVASLISGVGVFCLGAGLSFYHGIDGLLHPHSVDNFFWAYVVLGLSTVAEGGTLVMAIKSIHKGAKERGMSFYEYVLESKDPTVNVVLLEDAAAVVGVLIAVSCMGLSSITGSYIPDAVGSLLVGSLLGAVALFIIQTNSNALVGRSISPEKILEINQVLEEDVMVRAIHDVKGIDMGNDLVRYKAEVDIDGRQLTRRYLNSQDLERFFDELQQMTTIEELEAFLLKHGENIVDLLGAEIDRIEQKLKARFPELRHVDLEVL